MTTTKKAPVKDTFQSVGSFMKGIELKDVDATDKKIRNDLAIEAREVNEDKLEVEFIISSPRRDDFGTRFEPKGMDLSQFRLNPIVLFRHMRDGGIYSLPVARALPEETKIDRDGKIHMKARFTPESVFPFGFQVYKLIKNGFLNMASIGAQIVESKLKEEEDGETTLVFTKWKLFEFSVVPIGANDDALVTQRAKEFGVDISKFNELAETGINEVQDVLRHMEERGFVPSNPNDKKADVGEAWSKPSLSDFTSESWDDLSATEKRKIARHFAYADSLENYSSLKLPHHRASDGAVVFRGVSAAAGRLNQTSIPSDMLGRVKAHLRRHYKDFDKDVPETLREFLETEDQKKYREYFEQVQPLVKPYRKLLDKLYKRIGLEKPQDEFQALEQITKLILPPIDQNRSFTENETRTPSPKDVKAYSAKLAEYVVAKKREALANGVPLSRIEKNVPEWVEEAISCISFQSKT